MNIPLISTFILGALHSLEPGHGKSIVALHSTQSDKISEGISLLASLLLTHFLLVVALSCMIYFNPEILHYAWIKFVAPILVIFYGLFLLIKSRKNSKEYIGCSCSHDHESTDKKNPILLGVLAGLTPCPSVFSPIVFCMSNQSFGQIFYYLVAYIFGVISVFVILFITVILLKKSSTIQIESLMNKFNPHLISGVIMLIVGIAYLVLSFTHSHS